ncbi:MAG: hypothetical protein GY770_09270 [Aestuariibacter sp.]|nr:hypothetical protein [Aestuariibacter sp.]
MGEGCVVTHIQENIGKHIDVDSLTGLAKWGDDAGPAKLHYELRGTYFDETTIGDIRSDFGKLLSEDDTPPFPALREIFESGTDIDEFLVIEVDNIVVIPLSD